MPKTILITGTSSGFGRDTAETLHQAGHTVYASMRGLEGKNRDAAAALQKLGIKTVELDVSDDASVEAGVENVLAEAGNKRLPFRSRGKVDSTENPDPRVLRGCARDQAATSDQRQARR